jgi:hypothetical protein
MLAELSHPENILGVAEKDGVFHIRGTDLEGKPDKIVIVLTDMAKDKEGSYNFATWSTAGQDDLMNRLFGLYSVTMAFKHLAANEQEILSEAFNEYMEQTANESNDEKEDE